MIPRKSNLEIADEVIAKVQAKFGDYVPQSTWIECYSNGREQGYSIHSPRQVISFSEYRSSDDIVIYVGKQGSFSMQGNVPDEEAYNNSHFFYYNQQDKAAEFIYRLVKDDEEVLKELVNQLKP